MRGDPRMMGAGQPAPSRVSRAVRMLGLVTYRMAIIATIGVVLLLVVGPRTGHYRTATVLSGSMEPYMPAGSVIIATPQARSALAPGQVITFTAPDGRTLVTHRVVRVDRTGPSLAVTTKGDNNPSSDSWTLKITSAQVWRTRAVVPFLGHLIVSLRSPAIHRLSVIAIPAALAVWWIVMIWSPKPAREQAAAGGA